MLGRRSLAVGGGSLTGMLLAAAVAGAVVGVGPLAPLGDGGASHGVRLEGAGGALGIGNSREGKSVLSGPNLRPGDETTGTVTISNTGHDAEEVAVEVIDLQDHAGVGGGLLSDHLRMTVDDVTAAGQRTQVWAGVLSRAGRIDLGRWPGGDSRTYRVTVRFPLGSGSAVQGSWTSVGLDWVATDPPAGT